MSGPVPTAAFDIAMLLLRIGLGWVFLYAAWKNTENAAARAWTRNETALLFSSLEPVRRERVASVAATIGLAMMYGGGAAVLFGVAPRAGGLAIALFSALGMRIHALRRDEAKLAGEAGDAMGWSAFGAHVAAGLKNWALIASGIMIVLVGAGSYALGPDPGATLAEKIFR
jgi:uncharacterized membrane protein YphA (DoxX/SURF4 family)